jgi:hypothetical protein
MLAVTDLTLSVTRVALPHLMPKIVRCLMMAMLCPMLLGIRVKVSHVVLLRILPMWPLTTEAVRCDERSHLECNRNLVDLNLLEFEQYV